MRAGTYGMFSVPSKSAPLKIVVSDATIDVAQIGVPGMVYLWLG